MLQQSSIPLYTGPTDSLKAPPDDKFQMTNSSLALRTPDIAPALDAQSVICHGAGAWARDLTPLRAPASKLVVHSHQVG